MTERIVNVERVEDLISVFGSLDENIHRVEQEFGVQILNRGSDLKLSGEEEATDKAARTIEGLMALASKGEIIDEQKVRYLITLVQSGNDDQVAQMARDVVCITAKGKPIKAKTIGQQKYMKAIQKHTITVGVGPAGTGKTYLAVAAAVAAMLVVTVSAANSEAIMTYLTSLRDAAVAGEAWADSPVNTEEGTGGLCLPEASLEERDGRTILIVDGVETDVTQALTDQGEYLYECGEGEEQAQVTAEVEFTPTSAQGTVELTYTFDGSALAGKSVVVFEDLYQDENVVASHADINDEGQTVTFGQPEIGTTATIDGEKTAQPAEQITITDTVDYSGLAAGQEYTLKGVLMDKETGEPLLVNDQQVTSEATFTPAEPNGTIDVLFTFDATGLEGKSVVVFETLFQGETEIAGHEDIEDEGQTVTFVEEPKIGTTATVDGQHTAEPTGEITIVDVVAYSGLTPGETYKVSGILMDKATGEPLLVGEDQAQVTAEVEFTPESADGTVELTYTLDASALAGTTIVVFETLYSDGVEIAAHADINDEAQSITINPKGGLLIQKTSEDGVLAGFTFLVEGEGYSETFTTDGAGKIYIEDLAPGEYSITEQESELTARYEIPAGQTVKVTADQATTVEFYNQLLRGKITGHKTGAEQAPLKGVTFGLFDAEVTEFTVENALAITETDSDGEFSFEAPYGNYQVAELETVPGYVTKKESIAVELDKTDVDLEDIANSQTVVHFSKVDKDTGEELPGAVLELYAPDGSLLDTWETTDIPHVIPGLPVGEGYVLREVTAPEGFEVAEDVTFNVEDTTEIQTITMEDEKMPDQPEEPDTPDEPEKPDEPTPDIPQTGGSRAVIWVTGLLILALLGLCITVPLLRHINKQ